MFWTMMIAAVAACVAAALAGKITFNMCRRHTEAKFRALELKVEALEAAVAKLQAKEASAPDPDEEKREKAFVEGWRSILDYDYATARKAAGNG